MGCAGMVKRVRGVAHSMRVSPQVTNRMVDGARGPLNSLLADVFIFTDHMTGPQAGNSPGFGITLVAETTSGCLIGAEAQAEVNPEVSICRAEICNCLSLLKDFIDPHRCCLQLNIPNIPCGMSSKAKRRHHLQLGHAVECSMQPHCEQTS